MLYNCIDLTDHERTGCPGVLSGIKGFAVINPDATFTDFSDEAQWLNEIAAGEVKVVKGVKGEIGEPSAVETENVNPCETENQLVGHDWSAALRDFDVNEKNSLFYQNLKKAKNRSFVIAFCDGTIGVITRKTQFYTSGTPIAPASNRENKYYMITLNWYTPIDADDMLIVDEPAGIFDF